MVELTAENGRTVKRTDMGSVRDQRDKLAMKVLGTTVSNSAEFMFGQMVIASKVNGSVAADTDSGLSIGENGRIKVSGRKASKRDMEYRNPKAGLVTREVGPLGFRKVTGLRSMQMEVSFCPSKLAISGGENRFFTLSACRFEYAQLNVDASCSTRYISVWFYLRDIRVVFPCSQPRAMCFTKVT